MCVSWNLLAMMSSPTSEQDAKPEGLLRTESRNGSLCAPGEYKDLFTDDPVAQASWSKTPGVRHC